VFSTEILLNINRPPVADAGRDRDVAAGTDVEVDGRLSSDPDGDRLAYLWTLEERPAAALAELNGVDRARPVFFADEPGDYLLKLVVNDGKVESAASLRPHPRQLRPMPHRPPMPGPTRDVPAGASVRLDGRGSRDPEAPRSLCLGTGRQTGVEQRRARRPDVRHARLSRRRRGRYVLRLTVSDGSAAATPDEIVVTAYAATRHRPPCRGQDQSVAPASRVDLDGSASFDPDPGDGIAQYAWTFVAVPHGSAAALSPPIQVFPNPPLTSFFADLAGDYLIELVVTDQRGARAHAAPRAGAGRVRRGRSSRR
jgi:chitinase